MTTNRTTLLVLLLSCGTACGSRDEVTRIASPTGRLDAVLVETNGGATTSFGYLVYVVPHGQRPARRDEVASLYGAYRNRHAYGANLKWAAPTTLTIEYLRTQDLELRKPTLVVDGHTIEITLHSGVTDSSAPSGGMLYNLQKVHP